MFNKDIINNSVGPSCAQLVQRINKDGTPITKSITQEINQRYGYRNRLVSMNVEAPEVYLLMRDKGAWHDCGTIIEGKNPSIEYLHEFFHTDRKIDVEEIVGKNSGVTIRGQYGVTWNGYSLGTIGTKTEVYQNSDFIDSLKPWLDLGDDVISLSSIGFIEGGARVMATLEVLPANFEVKENDPHKVLINISHGHVNQLAYRVGFSSIRQVCRNTNGFALAEMDGQDSTKKIRHTQGIVNSVNLAQEQLVKYIEFAKGQKETFIKMADRKVSMDEIEKFFKAFKGKEEKADKASKKNETRDRNQFDQFLAAFRDTSMGNSGETFYDLYNASTQILTHSANELENESDWDKVGRIALRNSEPAQQAKLNKVYELASSMVQ